MEVSSSYYSGIIEALCVETPVYDIIIGNIKGARPPQDPDAPWSPPQMDKPGNVEDVRADPQDRAAVETRAMKTKRMASTFDYRCG